MRLTPNELVLLDAEANAGRTLPPEPLPGLDLVPKLAALTEYRQKRLAHDRPS